MKFQVAELAFLKQDALEAATLAAIGYRGFVWFQ
jgi:hypothetical protein